MSPGLERIALCRRCSVGPSGVIFPVSRVRGSRGIPYVVFLHPPAVVKP